MSIKPAWSTPVQWPSIVALPPANFYNAPKIDWINKTVEYKPIDLKPMVTNKIAATDPRWNNKVAWKSSELLKRQLSIETYSLEIDVLFDIVTTAVSKALNTEVSNSDVEFTANFGSPVYGNSQNISISVSYPVGLAIVLGRSLVDGKMTHSAYVAASFTQLPLFNGKPIAPSKTKTSFTIEFMQDSETKVVEVPKKRKIKI